MTTEETKPAEEPKIEQPPEENWKEKYLLTLAEMENMRKRMQKERHEMSKFGIESTIGEFLPAMDNFENALRFAGSASNEVKNWATGFEMILSQFKEVLSNNGIQPFSSVGTQFDPALHEAVEIVETTEEPDGVILQEFTKGYKSSTRTIRPARVKVAKVKNETKE
ncbi:MAG TPA: nucleotide exchange factor GrpE [Chlamydiales bacterium]|nr:nucleotide exchange factor GrpE [Chlamydiales bacterium]